MRELIDFIQDDDKLREERKKAKKNKDKYIGEWLCMVAFLFYCYKADCIVALCDLLLGMLQACPQRRRSWAREWGVWQEWREWVALAGGASTATRAALGVSFSRDEDARSNSPRPESCRFCDHNFR